MQVFPEWAPRLSQQKIRAFYATAVNGVYDEDIINEVGYGLLARCESFIKAVEAVRGRAYCPKCAKIIEHGSQKEEILRCSCGWLLP